MPVINYDISDIKLEFRFGFNKKIKMLDLE